MGTPVVTASIGLRQSCSTSCLLVVRYFFNDFITLIKQSCSADGFLALLLVLVLMDDSLMVSMPRDGMRSKIIILKYFCTS